VICDAQGIPLVIAIGPANQRDEKLVEPMLKRMPMLPDGKGQRRKKPKTLQGDRGYGFKYVIQMVVRMLIVSLLAPRGDRNHPTRHGSGLGKTRYVIERTMAWIGTNRRLKLCYERTGEHFRAFHVLAACVICANRLRRIGRPRRF
jgi:transposase